MSKVISPNDVDFKFDPNDLQFDEEEEEEEEEEYEESEVADNKPTPRGLFANTSRKSSVKKVKGVSLILKMRNRTLPKEQESVVEHSHHEDDEGHHH